MLGIAQADFEKVKEAAIKLANETAVAANRLDRINSQNLASTLNPRAWVDNSLSGEDTKTIIDALNIYVAIYDEHHGKSTLSQQAALW
ncbi:MAG: hypothetical protein F6K62_11275, partial [Sphaerospermopsis sp. SIO1G2]|nr:hypothetical protein [Sphaerospermopsis sp. SIO1G2]